VGEATVKAAWLPWLVIAQLLLVVCSPALSLSGLAGAAVPLAEPLAATVVFVVAAGIIAAAGAADASGLAAGAVSCTPLFGARIPARQCDPDAAGHVRPRAPWLGFTLRHC